MRSLYQQAAKETDSGQRTTLVSIAQKMDEEKHIAAMVKAASAAPPISARLDMFDLHDMHVVAANGVINLRTGERLPHSADQFYTKHLGGKASVVYDPKATCPNWLAFLDTIFEKKAELIAFVQRAFGYSLTGDTSEEVWFLLTGGGNNGKSTLVQALRMLMGMYAGTIPPSTLMAKRSEQIPADIAKLFNVRAAFAGENEENRRLAEALIKALTGQDEISARFLHQNWFDFTPKVKLWLHTNHKPRIRDESDGTWRRIRPIPFNYRIPDAEVVKGYFEKHLLPELPGILAWAVRGCRVWQRDGLGMPPEMVEARNTYRSESDAVKTFLTEYTALEQECDTRPDQLLAAYAHWAKATHERSVSKSMLARRVREVHGIEPSVVKVSGASTRVFRGLALDNSVYGLK